MKNVFLDLFDSPIGTIYVLSSSKGLLKISFSKKDIKYFIQKHFNNYKISNNNIINRKVLKFLNAYFNRKRISIDIPIFMKGTEFQQKVWLELLKIPYGTVITYKDIAKKLKLNKGYQAIGQANSKNPFPILIPCHRVVKTDGNLGGYSCGISKKRFLLNFEGIKL